MNILNFNKFFLIFQKKIEIFKMLSLKIANLPGRTGWKFARSGLDLPPRRTGPGTTLAPSSSRPIFPADFLNLFSRPEIRKKPTFFSKWTIILPNTQKSVKKIQILKKKFQIEQKLPWHGKNPGPFPPRFLSEQILVFHFQINYAIFDRSHYHRQYNWSNAGSFLKELFNYNWNLPIG